jgi:Fe-S-cluster-containing dehydrogenase component
MFNQYVSNTLRYNPELCIGCRMCSTAPMLYLHRMMGKPSSFILKDVWNVEHVTSTALQVQSLWRAAWDVLLP